MENKKPEEGLQPDKKYISVEDWKTRPKPSLQASHQQEALQHNAAPPNNQAEHFPPAQTRADRAEGILTRERGRAPSAFPSPHAISYEASPSQGMGLGGGCGSVPSAVKISIGVADGDAPLSLLPWKDPA